MIGVFTDVLYVGGQNAKISQASNQKQIQKTCRLFNLGTVKKIPIIRNFPEAKISCFYPKHIQFTFSCFIFGSIYFEKAKVSNNSVFPASQM